MHGHSKSTLLVLIVLAIFLCPARSEAQWTLYDDFSSGVIDPAKWYGIGQTSGPPSPTTEAARIIKDRKLELLVSQYGRDDIDSGTPGGSMGLQVTDPNNIIGLKATVVVRTSVLESCATNPSGNQRGRALMQGRFFNDGLGGTGQTGDIFATIVMAQDINLGAVIQAFLRRCIDSTCSNFAIVDPLAPTNFVKTWTKNKAHTLSILWDQPNKKFIFSVTSHGTPTEVIEAFYTGSDSGAPVADVKQLVVNNTAPNCGGSQNRVLMDATFEDVYTQ